MVFVSLTRFDGVRIFGCRAQMTENSYFLIVLFDSRGTLLRSGGDRVGIWSYKALGAMPGFTIVLYV